MEYIISGLCDFISTDIFGQVCDRNGIGLIGDAYNPVVKKCRGPIGIS